MSNLGKRLLVCRAAFAGIGRFTFKCAHADAGMPDFSGKLRLGDLEKIKTFMQGTADANRPK
jgi:quinohemoprotein ethanol dehydrogenase